jgi:hypothetical protein
MSGNLNGTGGRHNRRNFLKTGFAAAGASAVGVALLDHITLAKAQSSGLTVGDVAILQFLAAGELLEADFWTQYNELGGIQDSEVSGGTGNVVYTERLQSIDRNFPQYIHDNTDDEISHAAFINAYLVSRGAEPVDLDPFRTLEGSKATGSSGKPRLTNLMQLTIDSSWWTRYRSSTNNPDVNPTLLNRPCRICTAVSTRPYRERMTICIRMHTSRRSRTPQPSRCLR